MSDNIIWGGSLIGIAFVLGLVEIFIPSMGLIAAVAGLCALGGVVALFQEGVAWGFTGMGTVVIGAVSGFFLAIKVLPHTPMGRGLILGDFDEEQPDDALREANERRELEEALQGASGVAKTDLHPVGHAEIEGARVEVIARTGAIEAGTPIRVVEVRGNEVYVRADTPD
ncbi:MAG: NfeD family protein [Planctomycetota bacterium]